tara:strand:+ start:511 stop:786 length:276 start_codon:yes stop_codon:yes gene_type:complete
MKNKRIIEIVKEVLGDEQLSIGEIIDRLHDYKTMRDGSKRGRLQFYPSANRLSSIMRGRFEMVSIGSVKCKKNEWRNKNVVDRKIQAEKIE